MKLSPGLIARLEQVEKWSKDVGTPITINQLVEDAVNSYLDGVEKELNKKRR